MVSTIKSIQWTLLNSTSVKQVNLNPLWDSKMFNCSFKTIIYRNSSAEKLQNLADSQVRYSMTHPSMTNLIMNHLVIQSISQGQVLGRNFSSWGAILIDECPQDRSDFIFLTSNTDGTNIFKEPVG